MDVNGEQKPRKEKTKKPTRQKGDNIMTLVRYNNPARYTTMQDTMNSLVNALFNTDVSETAEAEFTPRMDMKEDENNITVSLTMPGIAPENIDVSINENVLTVKGSASKEEEKNEEDAKVIWHVRENSSISYYRATRLPANVIADKADADYKNGILTLTLPKAEEAKPKTIAVKSRD